MLTYCGDLSTVCVNSESLYIVHLKLIMFYVTYTSININSKIWCLIYLIFLSCAHKNNGE